MQIQQMEDYRNGLRRTGEPDMRPPILVGPDGRGRGDLTVADIVDIVADAASLEP